VTGLSSEMAAVLAEVLDDPNPLDAFNDAILDRVDRRVTLHDGSHPGEYWAKQKEIAAALWDPTVDTIVVPAGHSVGKSFFGAGALLGWPTLQPDGLVVSTSPSNTQLSGVLWKEVGKARAHSGVVRSISRLTKVPNKFDLGPGWGAIGYATNKAERLQGWHSIGPLLVLVDEASGIDNIDIWTTLESLKPWKKLLLGNPLWAHGEFYSYCRRADEGDPTVRKIQIPSTLSPDIRQERSLRGLADRKFLENMAAQYGVGSQTWKVRVEAEFPDDSADALIPSAWLDRCESARHVPAGHRRIAIDLGLGNGGDPSVILVRDDNGVLYFEQSDRWAFEETARRARLASDKFAVASHRITWDVEGLGAGFANFLRDAGLVGCVPYRGQILSKDPSFANLRAACHVLLRRRLDPAWKVAGRDQTPFQIPREFMVRLRKELRELTHTPGLKGQIVLRTKEAVQLALRHSPDFTDTLAQSFAFPHS